MTAANTDAKEHAMTNALITGWGMYAPSRVMTNDDLAKIVDTNDEWIVSRTGIRERRIAADDETTTTLSVHAARDALAVAGVDAADVDLIVLGTCSPDYPLPATACLVARDLGATKAAAFDLAAACSGFVYALATANGFIRSGMYRNVLVIGVEVLSRFLDWQDRNTCVLFGDGAGAVLLQASDQPGGLTGFQLFADGSGFEGIIVPAGGSACPASPQTAATGQHFVHMAGRDVYRYATRQLTESALAAVRDAGITMDDIDQFVFHQANLRIIESVGKQLGMPMEKCFVNIEKYGNTSAASVPMALVEAIAAGRIHPGDRILMVAFGAGFTAAAAVVEWTADPQRAFLAPGSQTRLGQPQRTAQEVAA
ncbi:MAG TPA: beta-ketoacyl-ACP synthase III [Candidatus Limnocylindria bacterium]|jgi:3-oxoacyl-[acyl-carrier-protein] synthase-3|nr:beta-ketoacyl-ACP synthase III [Candidatus Limnocylindria bacterium]